MEELCYKDVNLEYPIQVVLFNGIQDIHEPLEILVRRTDPEEVNLRII
jgi:hypothetical protein